MKATIEVDGWLVAEYGDRADRCVDFIDKQGGHLLLLKDKVPIAGWRLKNEKVPGEYAPGLALQGVQHHATMNPGDLALGIRPGSVGLVAIDLDEGSLEEAKKQLPPPLCILETGREDGYHFIYNHPGDGAVVGNVNGKKLGDCKVDVRGDRGYIKIHNEDALLAIGELVKESPNGHPPPKWVLEETTGIAVTERGNGLEAELPNMVEAKGRHVPRRLERMWRGKLENMSQTTRGNSVGDGVRWAARELYATKLITKETLFYHVEGAITRAVAAGANRKEIERQFKRGWESAISELKTGKAGSGTCRLRRVKLAHSHLTEPTSGDYPKYRTTVILLEESDLKQLRAVQCKATGKAELSDYDDVGLLGIPESNTVESLIKESEDAVAVFTASGKMPPKMAGPEPGDGCYASIALKVRFLDFNGRDGEHVRMWKVEVLGAVVHDTEYKPMSSWVAYQQAAEDKKWESDTDGVTSDLQQLMENHHV